MPLHIIRGDITEIEVDAIVNPTDYIYSGGGGTDYAIHQAAGEDLEEALDGLPRLYPGEVQTTPSFGLTTTSYIIHAMGPIWENGSQGERATLERCYRNALKEALSLGVKSIAFPLISSGTFRFPADYAATTAITTINAFLEDHPELEVTLVLYSRNHDPLLDKVFPEINRYIEEHYEESVRLRQLPRILSRDDGPRKDYPRAKAYEIFREPPDDSHTSIERKTQQEEAPDIRFQLCLEEDSSILFQASEEDDRSEEQKAPEKKKETPTAKSAFPRVASKRSHWDKIVLPPLGQNLQDVLMKYVNRYVEETGEKESAIYNKAMMKKDHYSKIKSAKIMPKKYALLSLAIAMELSLEETEELLKTAGYALSNASIGDLVIQWAIREKLYDIHLINEALLSYDAALLGSF